MLVLLFAEEGEIEEDCAPNEIEDEDWVSPEKLQLLGMHTIQNHFHRFGITYFSLNFKAVIVCNI